MNPPSRKTRLFFWLLLAIFSTFFAEVIVASAPLVFWKLDGWLITVPVYGLHILVLSPLIIRKGRVPAWQSVYLTGTILGLYEAYMTKILWAPTWNLNAFRLGGVAVLETFMLVLFWHPVMAFLVPLIFSERFLNLQPGIIPTLSLPWIARLSSTRFMAVIGGLAGLALGCLLADPSAAAGATILNSLLILVLLWIWKRTTHNQSFRWDNLLPHKSSWIIFAILLLLDFIFLGLWARPEAIPSLDKQFTIWVMYAFLGWLTFKARGRQAIADDPPQETSTLPTSQKPSLKLWIIFAGCFAFTAISSSFLLAPIKNYMFLAVWAAGIPTGIFLFYRSLRWVFSTKQ